MPTSGGGGHGGFGGGGSFHSSSGGGSRGGGNFHLNTFWFFAPHYYYRRGFGVLVAPIVSLVIEFALIGLLLFAMVGIMNSKKVDYSEETASGYALEQYEALFKGEAGYEDKVLLVLFTYENHVDYDFIAMIGDDLSNSVYNSLRGSNSTLSRAMDRYISSVDYETTLGRDLSSVVDDLKESFSLLGNPFSSRCHDTVHVDGDSYLINKTDLEINEDMVNTSLTDFTAATEIEMVVLVTEAASVFGYVSPGPLLIVVAILLVIAGAIIFAVVRGMKARKDHQNGNSSGTTTGGYTTGAQMDGTQKNNDFPDGDNW